MLGFTPSIGPVLRGAHATTRVHHTPERNGNVAAHGKGATTGANADASSISPRSDVPSQVDGTRRLLRELGYVEGRNIRLEFRNAAGNVDALPALAQEMVREGGVDAIIAISTPAALAAYKATQTIPIVAFTAVDPVGSGLADSLAHPGRNVTGITVFSEETTVKRVELMREVVPRAVRLGTVTTKVSKWRTEPCAGFGNRPQARFYG